MVVEKIENKVKEYCEKHGLDSEEELRLTQELYDDYLIFGNCYLDMEKGRINPTNISEWKKPEDY